MHKVSNFNHQRTQQAPPANRYEFKKWEFKMVCNGRDCCGTEKKAPRLVKLRGEETILRSLLGDPAEV